MHLPQRVQTSLSKRSHIGLPHVVKQYIVRVPLTKPPRLLIPWTKDVNWMHIRRSEDALDICLMYVQFTSFVQGGHLALFNRSWWRPVEDVFCFRLKKISPRCFAKTLSKRLRNVFKTSWKDVLKTSSRPFQDVFKMSSRCIIKIKSSY